ncbi:hypothetical protein DPMN_160138 [Dreissena polymorpha]|uniref:Reverse transcriptase n=1 Tax=Dreissena polymorpha TaxID=45954 RepID=A0A9D4INH7_DREPO|nr:hypothetical protein DPMN_160138 [Dreissena polymorpha]
MSASWTGNRHSTTCGMQGFKLYKLWKCNIDPTSLIAIKELYMNAKSYVLSHGRRPQEFPVLQGTRHGSKSSPLLYLVFINGLIKQLENSGFGMCIYNMNICSPTVADDVVLISY